MITMHLWVLYAICVVCFLMGFVTMAMFAVGKDK